MEKEDYNYIFLKYMSIYLNEIPSFLCDKNVNSREDVIKELSILMKKEKDKKFIKYLDRSIKELDVNDYKDNAYYKNINLNSVKDKNWKIESKSYLPYELFVYDDLDYDGDMVIPKIGYFKEEFVYPVIYQNDREWMMITPNEINTMREVVEEVNGKVVTYGLGLGYFAYMASLKENVDKVIVVEKDKEVIDLFNKYILPNFIYKDKIIVINEDAFKYNDKVKDVDYVFVDIWHDPSDGIELYKRFKNIEKDGIKYYYWIEKTMKYYI